LQYSIYCWVSSNHQRNCWWVSTHLSDDDLIIFALNGLGSDFKEISAVIRARDTPVSFEELHDKLVEHEAFLKREESRGGSSATVNSTRTSFGVLHEASLPLKYWSHSFLAAAYLNINRLPTPFLKHQMPVRLFVANVTSWTLLKFPKLSGINPVKLLACTSIDFNRCKLPISR